MERISEQLRRELNESKSSTKKIEVKDPIFEEALDFAKKDRPSIKPLINDVFKQSVSFFKEDCFDIMDLDFNNTNEQFKMDMEHQSKIVSSQYYGINVFQPYQSFLLDYAGI